MRVLAERTFHLGRQGLDSRSQEIETAIDLALPQLELGEEVVRKWGFRSDLRQHGRGLGDGTERGVGLPRAQPLADVRVGCLRDHGKALLGLGATTDGREDPCFLDRALVAEALVERDRMPREAGQSRIRLAGLGQHARLVEREHVLLLRADVGAFLRLGVPVRRAVVVLLQRRGEAAHLRSARLGDTKALAALEVADRRIDQVDARGERPAVAVLRRHAVGQPQLHVGATEQGQGIGFRRFAASKGGETANGDSGDSVEDHATTIRAHGALAIGVSPHPA